MANLRASFPKSSHIPPSSTSCVWSLDNARPSTWRHPMLEPPFLSVEAPPPRSHYRGLAMGCIYLAKRRLDERICPPMAKRNCPPIVCFPATWSYKTSCMYLTALISRVCVLAFHYRPDLHRQDEKRRLWLSGLDRRRLSLSRSLRRWCKRRVVSHSGTPGCRPRTVSRRTMDQQDFGLVGLTKERRDLERRELLVRLSCS